MAKQEYVNYNEIADFAESLGKISFDLEKELETIDSKIKMLPGIWQGTAATNYYDRFVELSHNFIPAYEELMKAVLFLTSVGEGYDNLSNDLARRLKAELELGGFGVDKVSSADTTFAEGETPVPVEDTEEPDIINIPDTEESQGTQTPAEEAPTVEVAPVEPTPAPSKPGATPSTPSSSATAETDTSTSTKDKPETTAKDSTQDNTNKDTKTDSNLTAKEKLASDLGNITAPTLGGNNNANKPQSGTGSASSPTTPTTPSPSSSKPASAPSSPAPSTSGSTSTSGGNNNKKEDTNQFSSLKSIDEVAREVIRGNYGNGQERKDALAAAGYDYHEVQSRVNEILRGN